MIYAALVLTVALGWLLAPPRTGAGLFPRICFAFGAGAVAISFQLFVYSVAGLPWSMWLVLVPWVTGGAIVAVRFRRHFAAPVLRAPAWWEALLLAAALVPIAVWAPLERLMPLTSQAWDAWAIWLFKAKAFYLDGGIQPFLARASEFSTQPGYPLLVPLYATFLYVVNGSVADHAAKIVSPCFFVATLGVFYHFSRRFGRRDVAVATTVMLGWLPLFAVVAFRLAGYADTALAFYILVGAGFLYAWLREDRTEDLAAAILGGTAAAWTKNEGLLFLAGVLVISGGRLLHGRAHGSRWAIVAAPPAIVAGIWAVVRRSYGIDAADVTAGPGFSLELLGRAAVEMLAKAVALDRFNLVFVLFAAAAAAAKPLGVANAFWALPGLVLWQFAGAVLVYSTGANDLQWWIETSGDRILSQVAPVSLLSFGLAYSAWIDRAEAKSGEAAEEARPREQPASRKAAPARPKRRR